MSAKQIKKIHRSKSLEARMRELGYDPELPNLKIRTENKEAAKICPRPGSGPAIPPRKRNGWLKSLVLVAGLLISTPLQAEIVETEQDFPLITIWESIRKEAGQTIELGVDFVAQRPFEVSVAMAVLCFFGLLIAVVGQLSGIKNAILKRNEWSKLPARAVRSSSAPSHNVLHGCATRTGLMRDENQDATFTLKLENNYATLIGVFDGMGGRPGGREAAQFAKAFFKEYDWNQKHLGYAQLLGALRNCRRAFAERNISGKTTAILALVTDHTIHYAALGDGYLSLIHADGMTQQLFAPHHCPGQPTNLISAFLDKDRQFVPRTGQVTWGHGATLMVMSDGSGDLVGFRQLGIDYKKVQSAIRKLGVQPFCERFLTKLENLKTDDGKYPLHSDNMTLALAFNAGGRDDC